MRPQTRSTRQSRVVVHDAEHAHTAPAVADERGIAVDALATGRAAVDDLADLAVAAAVPRPLRAYLEPVALRNPFVADACARASLEHLSVRAHHAGTVLADGKAARVDETPEVVDGASVTRTQRIPVLVDAGERVGARARARRPDVTAEVKRLRLFGLHSGCDGGAAGGGEHRAAEASKERTPRHSAREPRREAFRSAVEELLRPRQAAPSPARPSAARRAARACSRSPWRPPFHPRRAPRRAYPGCASPRTSPEPPLRTRRGPAGPRARVHEHRARATGTACSPH